MSTLLRGLGFVALHTAIVAAYVSWLCDALPPLSGEGTTLVVAPVSAIAAVVLACLYPIVRAQQTHGARLVALAGGIWIAMLAFTLVVTLSVEAPFPLGFAALVFFAQALYGAPLFALVAVSAKLTSPLLIARPVRAWA